MSNLIVHNFYNYVLLTVLKVTQVFSQGSTFLKTNSLLKETVKLLHKIILFLKVPLSVSFEHILNAYRDTQRFWHRN